MNILDVLAHSSYERVEESKEKISIEKLKEKAKAAKNTASFKEALKKPGLSFICELKKASPSKGLINPEFDYLQYINDYEEGGASAISCLTEPTKFLGSLDILNDVTSHSKLPVLRKDFIIDPYQIYEAKVNGASAILLIAALLEEHDLKEYFNLAHDLDLDCLVEVHNEDELRKAINCGVDIIGINNRDLRDFTVDLNTTIKLAKKVPKTTVLVSESGIHTKNDLKKLIEANIDAVLIGESLMGSDNIPMKLSELINYED